MGASVGGQIYMFAVPVDLEMLDLGSVYSDACRNLGKTFERILVAILVHVWPVYDKNLKLPTHAHV